MTYAHAERRRSSSHSNERFPDLHPPSGDHLAVLDEQNKATTTSRTPSPTKPTLALRDDEWQARRENHLSWGNGQINIAGPRGHGRQKSLSDAFRTIRSRKASVGENAHELAEALKAPVSIKIIVRPCFAYM